MITSKLKLILNDIKRNKLNILFVILMSLVMVVVIVGISVYLEIAKMWEKTVENNYLFNVISISSEDGVESIRDSLKDNEHVKDVFSFYTFRAYGIMEDYVNDNVDGSIRIVGTVAGTKKIIYGRDLGEGENDMICPNYMLPGSYGYDNKGYNLEYTIDLKDKIGENIKINYVGEGEVNFKLVGVYDRSYDYSGANECYVTHDTLRNLNKMYQKDYEEDTTSINVLLDDIDNASIVMNNYKGVSYVALTTIKKDIGNKVLKITMIGGILLLGVLLVFCYFIYERKIIRESRNIGILKVCGYGNKEIKRMNVLENVYLSIVAIVIGTIISMIVLRYIPLKFFTNNECLSLLTFKLNIGVVLITILVIVLLVFMTTIYAIRNIDYLDINEVIYD